jgi:hypothetical protein
MQYQIDRDLLVRSKKKKKSTNGQSRSGGHTLVVLTHDVEK